ncbi:MAG: hypothetical protein DRI86_14355 [Bacteroidetes bacterium]|nr:MAG: hypothetical protein DRI86_14355 [Bacteroidota bacterium]
MKKIQLLGFLMLITSSLLFIQCTHDPYQAVDGIDGVDGANGADGADGADGIEGTASCVNCHSNSHRDSITAAYNISLHSIQTMMYTGQTLAEYTNRTYCAQCHTSQGFIEFQETGAIQDAAVIPTQISCTTCHSDHDTFDFITDGPDYALRNIEALHLIVDETYTIDYGNTSNSCIQCHQPRTATPTDDGNGAFTVTSSHWGPHHGPQSTMLEGIQGALISGSVSYPGIASSTHRTSSSCVNCHMEATTNGLDGSHSMWPTDNACITCHTGGVPSEVSGLASDMDMLAVSLENVIGWEYEFEVDGNGDLVLDANGDPIIVLDGNGDPVTLEVHGIIHDGHPNNGSFGEGATFTILEAQAAWNYLFVMEDKSEGVHNPAYAKALIQNSIEALD